MSYQLRTVRGHRIGRPCDTLQDGIAELMSFASRERLSWARVALCTDDGRRLTAYPGEREARTGGETAEAVALLAMAPVL